MADGPNVTDKPSILPDGSLIELQQTVALLMGMHDPTGGGALKSSRGATGEAATDETLMRLLTGALAYGLDTTQAGGSKNVPIAARGAVAAQAYALQRLLGDMVIRGDDGVTYSAVAARAASTDANVAAALVGLLTNARLAYLDERTTDFARLGGTSAPGSSGNALGLYAYNPRQDAFAASRRGRRFYITHQTLGTFILGQTAIAATTPTFMLRQNGSTVRAILRSITLTQQGTVAGGNIFIAVVLDTADRFSAGGTSVTPQNVNGDSAQASGITDFLTNPTATAAGAGTRVIVQTGVQALLGSVTQISFNDGVIVPATGAILVYTQALAVAPSWSFIFEFEEVPT